MAEMGRPSDYTPELADTICERIADGMSVREIARQDDMPAMSTIFRWLSEKQDFQEQYTRAKEAQAEYLAEEILDIADDAQNDYMARAHDKGDVDDYHGWVTNGEAIQRSRLRIESRKWLLGKLKPKKYGERITNHLVGEDGGPVKTETELTASDKLKGLLEGIAERSGKNGGS